MGILGVLAEKLVNLGFRFANVDMVWDILEMFISRKNVQNPKRIIYKVKAMVKDLNLSLNNEEHCADIKVLLDGEKEYINIHVEYDLPAADGNNGNSAGNKLVIREVNVSKKWIDDLINGILIGEGIVDRKNMTIEVPSIVRTILS